MVEDYGEKMKKSYQDYMNALEEERKKIQVFSRELPLCLDLVNQAIENCKQQLNFSVRSECEDQTSTESPVLEEFIPLKRSLSSEEEQQQHSTKSNERNNTKGGEKKQKNVDWMRSVQLWNQTPDPSPVVESKKTGVAGEGVSASGSGAFHPFNKSKTNTLPPTNNNTVVSKPVAAIPASSSTGDNGNKNNKSNEDKDGQRKARRCWSPELHRRFLQALQQLGGSHAATPKQIRELMKVDGLTNDEVKSHLQKYRLHTRRPAPSIQPNGSSQPTQFVVVGGIWVPPPEYSAAAATNGDTRTTIAPPPSPKGFYVSMTAPQLGLPSCSQQQQHQHHQQQQQQQQQLQLQGSPTGSERRSSHSVGNDNAHSDSREVTSSSSDTTTAYPAL